MRRLFIAINLPEDIKRGLMRIITQIDADISKYFPRNSASVLRSSAFRWLPPENWHLTISFLSYQPDEAILPIINSIRETAKTYSNILENIRISFEQIILAPPAVSANWRIMADKSNKPPRMIWLVGAKETLQTLGEIKNNLEDNLIKNGVRFQRENRPYNAHLTLARFQLSKLWTSDVHNINRQFQAVGRPEIENLSFAVDSIDLMESKLSRLGAEYEILTSVKI